MKCLDARTELNKPNGMRWVTSNCGTLANINPKIHESLTALDKEHFAGLHVNTGASEKWVWHEHFNAGRKNHSISILCKMGSDSQIIHHTNIFA